MSKIVKTNDIRAAVKGRETDVLDALGIDWRAGRPHITCPYPDHGGASDWRWDAPRGRAFCTCIEGSHSVFDVVMKYERVDFDGAKVRVAEVIGRFDLIRENRGDDEPAQSTDAASLLNPSAALRDDSLPVAYLAHRLAVAEADVPIPRTPMVGLKALGYYDPPPPGSRAKPKLVGTFPCAVFGTIAADGGSHAHRIYLAERGAGKADLGIGPDGKPRDPKKSARALEGDNTSGRSVFWGDVDRAGHIVVVEGIETGAAVAVAFLGEIEAGDMGIAAAISAGGLEAFQPYPATRRVTVAADRDEASKPDGRPGSRRGERAARAFGACHHETLDVAIALPGKLGGSVDWLDILRRDGAAAVRDGILAATPFVPTPAELEDRHWAKLGTAEVRRHRIRAAGGDLAEAVAKALTLLAREPEALNGVYVRGTLLVRAVRLHQRLDAGDILRPSGALAIIPVDPDWLRLRLAQIATWYAPGASGDRIIDPPKSISASVLAAAPWPGIPRLTGVVQAPTIRADGGLLTEAGYDRRSGLLFDPGDTSFPPIPINPTRQDAEAALAVLKKPFAEFPFADDASQAVALAAVLTAIVCRVLRAVPLIGYSAPKMASGKTLLATIPSYVACGRPPYLMSQAQDPADERKRLLSALIECPAMLVIDNVERALQSDSLCTAITEPTFSDRILGASKMVTVESNCLFAATGNNLQLNGDLTARAILCRLDPRCERPEERKFATNLHELIPAQRGELVAAALSIIRAYLAAGEPDQRVPNFARFEEWQRFCRFPLLWLGLADPCESRRFIEENDPVRENLQPLLSAWHDEFGNRPVTAARAIVVCTGAHTWGGVATGTTAAFLREAMMAVAGEKGVVNARGLGRYIAQHEGRIEGGLRFIRAGKSQNTVLWKVTSEGFQGFQGFYTGPSREDSSINSRDKGNSNKEPSETEGLERNPQNPCNPVLREVEL